MGGSVCLYGGVTYTVGSAFASSDGCNTCSCTTAGILCTLRACLPDAGTDATAACVLDATYAFGETGGHVIYEDLVTLTPPAAYQHRRRATGGTTADIMCVPALPACNSANAIDVADVLRDIADPDVQRALTAATPPLYGNDPRAYDGSVFSFLRGDGRGFLAGGACGASTPCTEVPAGIARLVTNLRALDQQQLRDASCAQLR